VNLIEASAGTGKTWTICGLYLRLLLERRFTVQQILVVTFTNAATAELRERIRTRLLDLLRYLNDAGTADADTADAGTADADPFITGLSEELIGRRGMSRQDLKARLELALHSFDEASIFTIHGFCQRALADNPFAAGLPMRTELGENDQALLLEVVHDFWRRHIADEAVTPEFARFICDSGDTPEKYARLLARHLAKPLALHIWPAHAAPPSITAAALDQPYQLVRSQWLAGQARIMELLTASLGSLHGQTYKAKSLTEAAAHWEAICGADDCLAAVGDKAHLFRDTRLAGKTRKNCATPTHAFFGHAEMYLALREQLETSLSLARLRLLKRLFEEASLQLQTLKRSRQVVSFNDMLANVLERLQHPDYPWLAGSIRTRFPAALIDEFQDTDPVQLAIFQQVYATDDVPVFLVGDPKQAIYSFRHADLHSYLRATSWASRKWSLTDNQRSSQQLLSGLNQLFGGNARAFILPDVQYRHLGFGDKRRPHFVDGSRPRAPLQVWRLPANGGGGLPKALAKSTAVEATAVEIARLLQAGRDGQIMLGERVLRSADIAVLVRSRALGALVKEALATLRVGAVELSRDSIFDSAEAREWETVLSAIASPARDALLRAALATDLLGCDAMAIERLAADETLLPGWTAKFIEYRGLWLNSGFGVMYRRFMADQAVAKRLLARQDGARRLTNCLHVGEELQQAAESHPSPEALLRYLKAAQEDGTPLDAAQLRLESDQDLVQIVTIHACKGLEYPIVFCPFLCDGGTKFGGTALEGYEYHDQALQPVIDFRQFEAQDPALLAIKNTIKLEQAAETVRILYVALTRAVHRCYLVAGPYQTRSPKDESARGMLNWLVAGQSMTPEQWLESTITPAVLDAEWQRLAMSSGGAMAVDPLPTLQGVPVQRAPTDGAALMTPAPPASSSAVWRLSSYSGLSYGARSERSAGDHDARAHTAPDVASRATRIEGVPLDDILRFPRGAGAGDCIHAVFESIDFTDRGGWANAIDAALASHPQGQAGADPPLPTQALTGMLLQLVEDVTAASLRPGLQLAGIPLNRRLTELEFNYPVPHLSAAALNSALDRLGYEVPSLAFGSLEGYLKGFIDLVFEHRGQYFILDWKSNHLGYAASDYGGEPIARAMADHGYHLQYLLYALALDRYLRLRLAEYRYETHFGGVLYLFVRGVRPAWSRNDGGTPGVYFHRPRWHALQELNQLLGSAPTPVESA
jgi:exodeoxyribonuclease V beta subunit